MASKRQMASRRKLVQTRRFMPEGYISTAKRPPARRTRPPISHEEIRDQAESLTAILHAIAATCGETAEVLSFNHLRQILREHPKRGHGFFAKSQILAAYRLLANDIDFAMTEAQLIERLRFRPTRTQSGVTPVTVLTKPFPCPGQCIFCPNDVRMPKSYLSDEPAAQRAEDHDFDPFLQTWVRLRAYYAMGHPLSKIELIVLGGTWSFYSADYQRWFIKRCLDALNTFDGSPTPTERTRPFSNLQRHVDGRDLSESYNKVVTRQLKLLHGGRLDSERERCSWEELEEAQKLNETASSRIVGMVMETRPDHISEEEVLRLRRLGATKAQVGFQSLSDDVLALNKRGHDVAATARTVSLLRQAGFKIHAHWMANLKGSTPADDCADFERVVSDPEFLPDELKVYPCSLIESAELMTSFEDGSWRPYNRDELLGVLTHVLEKTPRYCRITRMIRDIPATDIVTGNRLGNLRETAEAAEDLRPVEIRSREVRERVPTSEELTQKETSYRTSTSTEFFLEWVTGDDQIAAFLRLSLPTRDSFVPELGGSAVIREVHVYGRAVAVGARDQKGSQHAGLGQKLIEQACRLAQSNGFENVAVISAIGTRDYYRKRGFEDGTLYQHRSLL